MRVSSNRFDARPRSYAQSASFVSLGSLLANPSTTSFDRSKCCSLIAANPAAAGCGANAVSVPLVTGGLDTGAIGWLWFPVRTMYAIPDVTTVTSAAAATNGAYRRVRGRDLTG